jgi:hypothetical protein
MHSSLLAPVITLVLWTHVMCVWLYATRIPAIRRNRVALNPQESKEVFNARLPPEVRWKADNYNHLMEQPTIFYAVVLALAIAGGDSAFHATLAWLYVALRIVHSLIHASVNIIMLRFGVFILATLVLAVLSVSAARVIY